MAKYDISLSRELIKIFFIVFVLLFGSLAIALTINSWLKYIPLALLSTICLTHSYVELDKRVDINESIKKIINKRSQVNR